MPERLPYDEAMLFGGARIKIPDPEIKQGKVEVVTFQTAKGKMQRPWGIEGGFAVVYKYRKRSGLFCALRCFRVSMSSDTQFRYEHIGPYFSTHARHITAGFKYHEKGILVKELGQGPGQKDGLIYPVIEMDWIEGLTLLDKVDDLCMKGDRAGLLDLAQRWLGLISDMQQAHFAHGDLAGVNVMVKADGSLVLIDYDGVYIPKFAGMPPILMGQPDFQHPDVSKRKFNEGMDAFSALVIYTVLLALAERPELWMKHMKRSPANKLLDTNMLFTQHDFQDPDFSALFKDLALSKDKQVQNIVQELKRACHLPLDQVVFPLHLVDPHYQQKRALERFEAVLAAGDDEQIAQAWSTDLDQYQPAHKYLSELQAARKRVSVLQQWRAALQDGRIAAITSGYDPALDDSKAVTEKDRDTLRLALRFAKAFRQNDADTLVELGETLQQGASSLTLTPEEARRVDTATRRKNALATFRKAIDERDIERAGDSFKYLQQQLDSLTGQEKETGRLALDYVQATTDDDDETIVAAFEAIQNSPYRASFAFTKQAQERVKQALQKARILSTFRAALATRNVQQIAIAYDASLETQVSVKKQEREILKLSRAFAEANDNDQDVKLIAAYDDIQRSIHRVFFLFSEEEQNRVKHARLRRAAYEAFRQTLQSGDPRAIAKGYDTFFEQSLTPDERQQLKLAQNFIACIPQDDTQFMRAYKAIQNSSYASRFVFTPQELGRLQEFEQREQQQQALRKALQDNDAQAIIRAYNALSLSLRSSVMGQEHIQVERAGQALAMRSSIQRGIDAEDGEAVRKQYDPILASQFPGLFSADQQRYIHNAMEVLKVDQARREGNPEQAIRLANDLQHQGGLNGRKPQLIQSMRRLMRGTELQDLRACIAVQPRGNRLVVQWRWPTNDLVQHVMIFWGDQPLPRFRSMMTRDELATIRTLRIVPRRGSESMGREEIGIDSQQYIYTKVCAAMYDTWDRETSNATWCFSPAIDIIATVCHGNAQATGW